MLESTIILGALVLLVITILYLYVTRDISKGQNEVEKFKAVQNVDKETFIAKIQHEGKVLEISNNTQMKLAQIQLEQSKNSSTVEMHSKSVECEKEKALLDFQRAKLQDDGKTKRTELELATNSSLEQLRLDFQNTKLNTKVQMHQGALNSAERMHASSLDFGREMGQLTHQHGLRELETTKYVANLKHETQSMIQQAETSRFALGCQTQVDINREVNFTDRLRIETHKDLTTKAIDSKERCFKEQMDIMRFQATEETRRAGIEAEAQMNNPLNAILGTVIGGVLGAKVPALAAIKSATSGSGLGGRESTSFRPSITYPDSD